ncbi:UDP-N-acetylmuramoyl-tripeptide--D-alanyl-D-alanine ligase [Gammaproteobacteria bacterium MOLA455]|nr:UDP-N-acetylmuramoyl-tripeptide--D-alanyl-D-alanine ligase [Gammaproteobacteria bacterium MOLA455]
MINSLRLTDAAIRFGGTLLNPDCEFDGVSIDSRSIAEGDLFVALIGERQDGHKFLADVSDRASGLVVSAADRDLPLPQWVVEDTTVALGQLAQLQREAFSGTVIAVTGSTGKTSVKDLISSILGGLGTVHATKGNFNNHIGVPLTLLDMQQDSDFAVVEMGASAASEISYLCSIAQPHISLINNVQSAHLEGFGSVAGIAAAKGEIYSSLDAAGTAILNLDQQWQAEWMALIGERACITFSLDDDCADVSASDIEMMEGGCCRFTLHLFTDTSLESQVVSLAIPGRHSVSNALAAAACAMAAGASIEQIVTGLEATRSPARRLEIKALAQGGQIIDDSYNASPESVRAAIDVLASRPGRRVMVLGDMAELGVDAEQLHREVGDYALSAGIDQLYTLGNLSASASAVFNGQHFADLEDLKVPLFKEVERSDLSLLVKGSRSSKMDLIVDILVTGKS